MLAYHNDPAIKEKYLARVRAHAAADEIIHGKYWENGKGCAVGCTIHSGHHKAYESELGIPVQIAHLEDFLFERLPNGESKGFPERFLDAIPVGADLSMVIPRFMVWLLADPTHGVIRFANDYPRVRDSVSAITTLYERVIAGETASSHEWKKAAAEATAARWAAEAAAEATAEATAARWAAAARWEAAEAAEAAATAAEARWAEAARWAAAEAAEAAAEAAATAARWAEAARWAAAAAAEAAAEEAAEAEAIHGMSEKLFQLLTEAPNTKGE